MEVNRRTAVTVDTAGLLILPACVGAACAGPGAAPDEIAAAEASPVEATTQLVEETEGPRPLSSFDPELGLDRAWMGDLDGMVERGFIRALVTYSKTNYFLDGGTRRGAS